MARTHRPNRTLLDLCVPVPRRTSCDLDEELEVLCGF
ncbi:MAG: hypothetical protein QOG20_3163 [Pseudonocardiales bacterium]|jgi:hypothetical protein|nr:hypothetical protein [Pseudonocardiales bacterium]